MRADSTSACVLLFGHDRLVCGGGSCGRPKERRHRVMPFSDIAQSDMFRRLVTDNLRNALRISYRDDVTRPIKPTTQNVEMTFTVVLAFAAGGGVHMEGVDVVNKKMAEHADFEFVERQMLFWGGVVDQLTKAGKGPPR